MPEIRCNLRLEQTTTAGDYTSPTFRRIVTDLLLSSLNEGNYRRVRILAPAGVGDTLDLTSEALRGGVADVRALLIIPSGACDVSRAGGGGENWRIAANGIFFIQNLTSGIVTNLRLVNQTGAAIDVDLFVAGN